MTLMGPGEAVTLRGVAPLAAGRGWKDQRCVRGTGRRIVYHRSPLLGAAGPFLRTYHGVKTFYLRPC